jgi:hypothetical protein
MSSYRTFNVPFEKSPEFATEFFYFFSECIDQLGSETEKWPSKVTFCGRIGKELIDLIEDKEWDFNRFNITHTQSPRNIIVIEYIKPLDQVEERGHLKGDSLHGQTMEGIPGDQTAAKIADHAMSMNFRIERKIRPKLEIELIR